MIKNDYKDLNEKIYSSFGFVVQKLGSSYKLLDTKGRLVFKEEISAAQIQDILKFLENGCFEGMFKANGVGRYQTALMVHFDEIDKITPPEDKDALMDAIKARAYILKKYFIDHNVKAIKEEAPQPEA